MRSDRLMATLLFLQTRGRVTAAEVAAELEVSVATARRDLEALGAAGVPVYPQPGRGGGWALVGGARTDLSGLSASEAQSLFLLLGPAADVSGEAKVALRKLVRALPSTFRDDAQAAAGATVVDRAGWGATDRPRPALLSRVQSAVVRRERLVVRYADHRGRESKRLVDPWGVVDKDDVWYLVAGTERGRRTFRVDRVSAAEPTGERFERPNDFVLEEAWRETVATLEERRARIWATVLVDPRFVFVLREHFGRHCAVVGEEPDDPAGRARVRVAAPTALDLARTLAGWGGQLVVLGPDDVRDQLARIGRELAAAYGSG